MRLLLIGDQPPFIADMSEEVNAALLAMNNLRTWNKYSCEYV